MAVDNPMESIAVNMSRKYHISTGGTMDEEKVFAVSLTEKCHTVEYWQ